MSVPRAVTQTPLVGAGTTTPGPPAGAGWAVMWRVELAKLLSQRKIRAAAVVCIAGPVVFVLAEAAQSATPADTLFGRWVHESGFAVSLLILGFASQWGLPFLMAIVAGDLFAEEDRHHTWSLLLTRSRNRGEIAAGKILAVTTVSVGLTVVLGVVSTLIGALAVGTQPVVGLDGTVLSTGTLWGVVAASWASVLPPALALTAFAVVASVVSRNSWVGVVVPMVVALVLDLVSLLSAIDPVRPYLPVTGFNAWHGLARTSTYTDQIWTSLLVSAGWIALCLGVATAVFLRRDMVDV